MTVLDLPRPAAMPDQPADVRPTPTRPLRWDEAARRPPSQHWCVRCARWHGHDDAA